MWTFLINSITFYHLGDLASVLGVLISVIGFAVTLIGVFKSQSAAARAENAARSTASSIRKFEAVSDFAAAISALEEIKRSQRLQQWPILPDRYAGLRKILISIRTTNQNLSEEHQTIIQSALASLVSVERSVERALENSTALKPSRLNAIVSREIDGLTVVLSEMKISTGGEQDGTR